MASGLAEFVVIANRLPVDRVTGPDGETTWRKSPGGLVTALEARDPSTTVARGSAGTALPARSSGRFDHDGM